MDANNIIQIDAEGLDVILEELAKMFAKQDIKRISLGNKLKKVRDELNKVKKENRLLKTMINTTIGIAYDKDENEAIDYLINERDQYLTDHENRKKTYGREPDGNGGLILKAFKNKKSKNG